MRILKKLLNIRNTLQVQCFQPILFGNAYIAIRIIIVIKKLAQSAIIQKNILIENLTPGMVPQCQERYPIQLLWININVFIVIKKINGIIGIVFIAKRKGQNMDANHVKYWWIRESAKIVIEKAPKYHIDNKTY